MGLLFDTPDDIKRKAEEADRLRKQQAVQQIVGTPIRQEESFVGGDVGPNGELPIGITQPGVIDPATFTNLETTQAPSGLLGNVQDPVAVENTRAGLLGAGFTAGEVNSITQPAVDAIQSLRDFESEERANKVIAKDARGSFKNSKEQLAAFNTLDSNFNRKIGPSRDALQQYAKSTRTLEERGGFDNMTGQDDIAFITSFSKMIKPNEAIMSDDVQNAMQSAGYGDQISAWLAAMGGKAMGTEARKGLYQAMSTAFNEIKPEYDSIRNQTKDLFQASGFAEDVPSPVRRDILGQDFQAFQSAPITPPEGAPFTQANIGNKTRAELDAEIARLQGPVKNKLGRIGRNPRGL